MSLVARRIVIITFVIIVVALNIILAYTLYTYVKVSNAVSLFDVTTQRIYPRVFNATYAVVETDLTFHNPSEYTLEISGIQLALYVNGEYLWVENAILHGMRLMPFSRKNATIEMVVPSRKVFLLVGSEPKSCYALIYVFTEVPLISRHLTLKFEGSYG